MNQDGPLKLSRDYLDKLHLDLNERLLPICDGSYNLNSITEGLILHAHTHARNTCMHVPIHSYMCL